MIPPELYEQILAGDWRPAPKKPLARPFKKALKQRPSKLYAVSYPFFEGKTDIYFKPERWWALRQEVEGQRWTDFDIGQRRKPQFYEGFVDWWEWFGDTEKAVEVEWIG